MILEGMIFLLATRAYVWILFGVAMHSLLYISNSMTSNSFDTQDGGYHTRCTSFVMIIIDKPAAKYEDHRHGYVAKLELYPRWCSVSYMVSNIFGAEAVSFQLSISCPV